MKRFSIVAKVDQKSKNAEKKVKEALLKQGYVYDKENPELVISVGGDGTLLFAVHTYIDKLDNIHFVALHTGTLGFFTDYREEEIDELIYDILKDDVYEVFTSYLLEANIDGKMIYALNEVRIENINATQSLEISIDNEYFESFKGNGMCLSTQAGSSAYNRSLGGAVVDSGISLLQLSEIAGIHDARHRSLGAPYILKDDRTISFTSNNFKNAKLCFDHKQLDLDNAKFIVCSMSTKGVKFVRYRKYSYLERVRNLY